MPSKFDAFYPLLLPKRPFVILDSKLSARPEELTMLPKPPFLRGFTL